MRLEMDSWVTLRAATRGHWGRNARAHGEDSAAGAWKAQIKQFRWSTQNASSTRTPKLEAVLVRHAYLRRQIHLDPEVAHNEPRCANYLYASFWEDWVHPSSILDIILVVHHEVGEATRNHWAHRDLMENGTFYLRAVYVPPAGIELYGHLEPIPLPTFDDPAWPVPDMLTSEAFRSRLTNDFAAAMKPTTGSKAAHIQWFLPMHVMVDLFATAGENVRRTTTMYVFKDPSQTLLSDLMNPGWDEKVVIGQDITKCVVNRESIVFRYHVGRQVLYANFQYARFRSGPSQTWIAIDQAEVPDMINMTVKFGDMELPSFEVGKSWPVSHIRYEIAIVLGRDRVPDEYDLFVERPGIPSVKVMTP